MTVPKLEDPGGTDLGRILRQRAEKIPDETYLIAGGERYGYGRVNQLANAHAAGLRNLGVGPGDRVALFLGSSPEFLVLTFAVNKLGAIWVPTSTDYRGRWLRASLEDSSARVLVTDAELLPRLAELGPPLPFEHIVVRGRRGQEIEGAALIDLAGLAEGGGGEPDTPVSSRDTAAVLWTSGTTGRPKGVMQSHSSWLWASRCSARNQQVRPGDVLYGCLPLYNSAAWVGVLYPALLAGVSVGLDPHFSVTEFWNRTRLYGATHMFTMGAMHIFLWQAPERPDDRDNPVRVACVTPIPDRILEPFKERFGIERTVQGYGQSEIMGLTLRVDDGHQHWSPNSVGRPQAGLDVRLLDEDDLEVPVGEVGELCVRPGSPFILFNGYFQRPEATLASFRNLWYHTGDLGTRNQEGELFFFDRKADYLRHKGRNISSFAVETVVNAHPAVAESAVYGVTAAELESEAEIKVDVVLEPGARLTGEELATFVNRNAPYFFVPRYIELVDELPHTPTGRVRKFELRRRGVTPRTWDREAAGFVVRR